MTPAQEAMFRSLIRRGVESECWPWQGSGSATSGFGYFNYDGLRVVATRIAWRLEHGEIPPGLMVTHTCRTKLCLNPAHLRLGTQKDRLPPLKEKVRCQGCGKETMRGPSVRRIAKCSACIRATQALYDAARQTVLRRQARRYRILLHRLGYEDAQYEELLAEIQESPMSFRREAESKGGRRDETNEGKVDGKNRRLLEAYGDGVDIEDLVERFGLTPDAINARAIRAGVQRPSGHIGAIRRAQRKTG